MVKVSNITFFTFLGSGNQRETWNLLWVRNFPSLVSIPLPFLLAAPSFLCAPLFPHLPATAGPRGARPPYGIWGWEVKSADQFWYRLRNNCISACNLGVSMEKIAKRKPYLAQTYGAPADRGGDKVRQEHPQFSPWVIEPRITHEVVYDWECPTLGNYGLRASSGSSTARESLNSYGKRRFLLFTDILHRPTYYF